VATTIGGPGIRGVEALDNEETLCEIVAEHSGTPRTYEGKLFVTNFRILFLPFETERILGAAPLVLPRKELASISYTLPETGELLRTPRAELRIRARDDHSYHFTTAFHREEFQALLGALGVGG